MVLQPLMRERREGQERGKTDLFPKSLKPQMVKMNRKRPMRAMRLRMALAS